MSFKLTSVYLATSMSVWLVFSVAGQEHLGGEAARIIEKLRNIGETEGTEKALAQSEEVIRDLFVVDRMAVWRYERQRAGQVHRAWAAPGRVCFVSRGDDKLRILDSATSKETAAVPLPPRHAWTDVWMERISNSGRMLLTLPGQIMLLDAESGKITETLEYKHDGRIAPVIFDGDYVLGEGYRAETLVRLTKTGQPRWRCRLPGYIMLHPAVYGPFMVVQTRGGSYGGQATSGVDLRTGKLLWSDTVDAYGCGASFADDATFVVETCLLLSPGDTFGWVICRVPETGERLWEYRRPGSISHQPLVEITLGRVFVLSDTGVVVCIDGRDGSIVWETRLPANAPDTSGLDYFPYSPVMRLHNGRLMVLDVRDILHLLDVKTGRILRSFPTVSRFSPDGKRSSKDSLVTMPWVDPGVLIVPSTRRITAYPVAQVLGEEEPLELQMRALRVEWLLRQGEVDKAAKEVALMQEARPEEPLTLECSAEVCRANKDAEGEVIARLRLMRNTGAETDARLFRLTGLLKRISCGYGCGPPLLVGERLYVGSTDGRLRAFDAKTLSLGGELDVEAAITSSLAFYDGVIVFPTWNRHVRGVRPDLIQLFDWSAPGENSVYIPVADKLIRSSPYIGFAHVAVLDLEKQGFGPEAQVDCSVNCPIVHNKRLYYPQKGGGSASYDGETVASHTAKLAVEEYRVSDTGEFPIAYGSGGAYRVDEHMQPAEQLTTTPGKTLAATVNKGIIVTLSMRNDGSDWMLEAWRETGEKLPLNYRTPPYYHTTMNPLPNLLPLGEAFLLVGREIACVSPYEEKPTWAFWPGGLADSDPPSFKGPVIDGDSVMFTHGVGDLYVFDKNRITEPLQK
jgi:outer membrane protein assembly factor BamB